MSNNASGIDQRAADENNDRASQALGAYQGQEAGYMSNVNSALAAGNPYQSKEYKTNQNLETSGAMNSENDAARAALGDTVARTGTNSAATAATLASSARAGQRDLTAYNASRDTANEDKWQQQKMGLMRDQLAGAESQSGVFGHSVGAQSADLRAMTDADMANQQMWGQMVSAGLGAAGTVASAGMKR